MTDRELLELAAKAAGYRINFEEPVNGYYPHGYDANGDVDEWWNPLEDDGDALRLAVCLGITISINTKKRKNTSTWTYGVPQHHEPHGDNPYAATRRSIVRAAVEIGKSL